MSHAESRGRSPIVSRRATPAKQAGGGLRPSFARPYHALAVACLTIEAEVRTRKQGVGAHDWQTPKTVSRRNGSRQGPRQAIGVARLFSVVESLGVHIPEHPGKSRRAHRVRRALHCNVTISGVTRHRIAWDMNRPNALETFLIHELHGLERFLRGFA